MGNNNAAIETKKTKQKKTEQKTPNGSRPIAQNNTDSKTKEDLLQKMTQYTYCTKQSMPIAGAKFITKETNIAQLFQTNNRGVGL